MATIKFRANIQQPATAPNGDAPNDSLVIEHTAPSNSGIGFYGGDFGLSVPVGSPQETTFVTSADGTSAGLRLQNTKYLTDTTVEYGGSTKNLDDLPNYYAPLNVRFTHDSPVRTQNCKLKIFNRQDVTKAAEDVDTWVYEIRHPNPLEAGLTLNHRAAGYLAHEWTEFKGSSINNRSLSSSEMALTSSPGVSGLNGNNTDNNQDINYGGFSNYTSADANGHVSEQHDWYLALSAEPTTIGSKTNFGLYFTLEYLD